MKTLDSHQPCPSCQQPMQPVAMACGECGVRLEARFRLNEFAALGAEDLHFLRTFINCEGRVRDMEAALGLSYPTIRARLSAFKERMTSLQDAAPLSAPEFPVVVSEESLKEPAASAAPSAKSKPAPPPQTPIEVLAQLQSGTLDYAEALASLRGLSTAAKGKKK